jgi:RND family efflux transporter MFP subunit
MIPIAIGYEWLNSSSARGAESKAEEEKISRSLPGASGLGRIEPRNGVIRVAGPPRPAVVIQELHIEEGAEVKKGEIIAVLMGIEVLRAEHARLTAVLANAQHEVDRNQKLYRNKAISDSDWKSLQLARDVAQANLQRAEAELALSQVRAPMTGRVLEIHARAGERVGPDGIVELADTSVMYVVAEIYETDIGRVRLGQHAWIRSPALSRELEGEVERIGLKVGKKDVLSTDPVADADARVVEVKVRLLDPEAVAALTNLRVEVIFNP